MYYYAHSLRQASFVMVNSSWTKNHVDSILRHSDILLDCVHWFTPLALLKLLRLSHEAPESARIVYPPCDTHEMAQFALKGRERIILSLAQFRSVHICSGTFDSNDVTFLQDLRRIIKHSYMLSINYCKNTQSTRATNRAACSSFLSVEVAMRKTQRAWTNCVY